MRGPFVFRNYRLYFAGQAISLVGTWMQQVAQVWLVYTLSQSGTMLGLTVAAQMLPVLLLSPWGGLLADRANKRQLLLTTQALLGLISLTMGALIAFDVVQIWMIIALALLIGVVNATANPARQSFVSELVEREHLRTAVSLNGVLVNVARAVGPAIAGVLIAKFNIQLCFFIDAASYLFVITALWAMDVKALATPEPAQKGKGQIREGLRYAWATPRLRVPLLMMVLIGTFAYEFQVLLPLIAAQTFNGGSGSLGALLSAQGAGAILGGIYVARHGTIGIKAVTRGAALFCISMTLASIAPTFWIEVALLFVVGATSVQFLSAGNTTIQLTTEPEYRGRVMALWTMAFLGSTPIGGPIIGWISEHFSPRLGMGAGAMSCFIATMIGISAIKTIRKQRTAIAVETT